MGNSQILVDTSILIEYFRKQDKLKTELVKIYNKYDRIYISSITVFEVLSGISDKNRESIEQLLSGFTVLSFNDHMAGIAAKVYQDLKNQNKIIEIRDLFIGATALAENLPLKTFNKKHFNRIKALKVR